MQGYFSGMSEKTQQTSFDQTITTSVSDFLNSPSIRGIQYPPQFVEVREAAPAFLAHFLHQPHEHLRIVLFTPINADDVGLLHRFSSLRADPAKADRRGQNCLKNVLRLFGFFGCARLYHIGGYRSVTDCSGLKIAEI